MVKITRYETSPTALYLFTDPSDIQTELARMRRRGTIGEDTVWLQDFVEKRFFEVARPSPQCTNTSAPASVCGSRVAFNVFGATFFNGKWSMDMEFQ